MYFKISNHLSYFDILENNFDFMGNRTVLLFFLFSIVALRYFITHTII